MTQALERTFDFLREVMPREPSWRVIGSAALWLSGVPAVADPPDVDVVAPSQVIDAVRQSIGISLPVARKPDSRFRSRPFFQFVPHGGVQIDLMGDLEVYNGQWERLRFESHVSVRGVFMPSLDEQIEILQKFGRPKDIMRADMVREFIRAK